MEESQNILDSFSSFSLVKIIWWAFIDGGIECRKYGMCMMIFEVLHETRRREVVVLNKSISLLISFKFNLEFLILLEASFQFFINKMHLFLCHGLNFLVLLRQVIFF